MHSYAVSVFFFFNDTATTEIYTLSLHDALPICCRPLAGTGTFGRTRRPLPARRANFLRRSASRTPRRPRGLSRTRSEEHTSELQSQSNIVCRLLLEKKKHRLIRPIVPHTLTSHT